MHTNVTGVEVHGFVWWITSSVAFVLYLLWAYVPDAVLEAHGVTWYPSKHWAVALPTWLCVTVVYVYWAYESLNMMATPGPEEQASTRRDAAWRSLEDVGAPSHFSRATDGGSGGRIPPLVDIPPAIVDMVLRGGKTPLEAERMYMLDLGAREERKRRRQEAAGKQGRRGQQRHGTLDGR